MRVLIRGSTGRLRTPMAFTVSGTIHGLVLAWVALGSLLSVPEPKSLYDQEIRGHEKHIFWYNLRDRLPEVSPGGAQKDPRPTRARTRLPQEVVAGTKDDSSATQRIWLPDAPEIPSAKPLPLPNMVAVMPRRLLKAFVPPLENRASPPALPTLPDAPKVEMRTDAHLPIDPANRRLTRAFTAPELKSKPAELPNLPEAPLVNVTANASLPVDAGNRRLTRAFIAPEVKSRLGELSSLPEAPRVNATVNATLPVDAGNRRLTRVFTPPSRAGQSAGPSALPQAPAIPQAERSGEVPNLAIVGLNPAKANEFPLPATSREAGFSGAPQPGDGGGNGAAPAGSTIVVPGLLARGKPEPPAPTLVAGLAPTSPRNLAESLRVARPAPAAPTAEEPGVGMISNAPDPMLAGRVVYRVAIQMPNITSYVGSWIVWFAAREPLAGALRSVRAPEALRKVDPKYIAAAAEERIEGKVRLSAVIRKNGHVDSVSLLRHVDDRLDRSAVEALEKWEFSPALRNGVPIDVDAVFEVPFQLAPRPKR